MRCAAFLVAPVLVGLAACGSSDASGPGGPQDSGSAAEASTPPSDAPESEPATDAADARDEAPPKEAAAPGDGGLPEPVVSCAKPGAPVVAARDFLDAWGVNAAVSAATAKTTAAQLDKVGIRRIRTELWAASLSDWQALQSAMTSGGYAKPRLKFNALVDAYDNNPVTWSQQQAPLVAAGAAGLLTSIEGPNEMNNPGVGGGSHGVNDTTDQTAQWAGPTGNVFQWMHAIRSWRDGLTGIDAQAMRGVDLIAPTIASGLQSDYAQLPDLGPLVDYGTLHYYAGSSLQPSLGQGQDNPGVGYFANLYRWCQAAVSPGKPLVVSECGATTAPGGTYSFHAQAAYYLNQMHEAAGIGAKRFYFYTLVDPQSGAAGGSEGNFGMFQIDGSDKDITVALASVKSIFSLHDAFDDPANASDTGPFAPGYDGCGLTVTGIAASGTSSRVSDAVAYMKSDGTTVLSVTNEPQLSDTSGNPMTPAPVTATVDLGAAHGWKVFDPLGPSPLTPTASGTGSTVQVTLAGYPMYIEVK